MSHGPPPSQAETPPVSQLPNTVGRLSVSELARQALRYLTGVSSAYQRVSLGWLPVISIVNAAGLVLIAFAFRQARIGDPWHDVFFWYGVLLLFESVASRLTAPDALRLERLGLLLLLGLSLYVLKMFHSPSAFTFFDELLHWRTAQDILISGRLFEYNPILPVSALHPGLEAVVTALVSISGLSLFAGGVLVIAVARCLMVGLLFLTYERISNSHQTAALATLIYIANPGFVFFDGQFAYESLALPFAILIIYAQTRLVETHRSRAIFWYLVLFIAIIAVNVTHHLTAYLTALFLLLWVSEPFLHQAFLSVIAWLSGKARFREMLGGLWQQFTDLMRQVTGHKSGPQAVPMRTALLLLSACVLWSLLVANIVIGYIGGYLLHGFDEVLKFFANEGGGRELFQNYSGEPVPLWERVVSYLGVLVIMLALLPGFFIIFRRMRRPVLVLALGLTAPLYPLSQVLRFTEVGLQISGRTVEFLFIGIAFVVAITATAVLRLASYRIGARIFIVVSLTIVFLSGIILGWPRWARYPGPYLVSADTRSIEPESLSMAQWSRETLGEGNRFAADRINGLLLGSYGRQSPVSLAYDGANIPQVYFAEHMGSDEHAILQFGEVAYLVVDKRLAQSVPISGIYFELNEPNASRHQEPIDASLLRKFDDDETLSRVFDSGNIVIYRVETIAQ